MDREDKSCPRNFVCLCVYSARHLPDAASHATDFFPLDCTPQSHDTLCHYCSGFLLRHRLAQHTPGHLFTGIPNASSELLEIEEGVMKLVTLSWPNSIMH